MVLPLNCFSLLMFQGVGFLHLKLPVFFYHFVKSNKKAAAPHRQFSVHWYYLVICVIFICAVWSSIDISFRLKFLSNLCILKPASETRFGGQIVVFILTASLLFFPLKPFKKKKVI